jgi:hypothetical protein
MKTKKSPAKTKFKTKLLKQSGATLAIKPADGTSFTFAELKGHVGGRIEIVFPQEYPETALVLNEEAKLTPGLVKNEQASRIWQKNCKPGSSRSRDDIFGDALHCLRAQLE